MMGLNAVMRTPVLAAEVLSAHLEQPADEEIKEFRSALEGNMSGTLPEQVEYCAISSRPR